MAEEDNKNLIKKEPKKIEKLKNGDSVVREIRKFSKTKPPKAPKKK